MADNLGGTAVKPSLVLFTRDGFFISTDAI